MPLSQGFFKPKSMEELGTWRQAELLQHASSSVPPASDLSGRQTTKVRENMDVSTDDDCFIYERRQR